MEYRRRKSIQILRQRLYREQPQLKYFKIGLLRKLKIKSPLFAGGIVKMQARTERDS